MHSGGTSNSSLQDYTHMAKVVVVGDSGVGKTCIVQRLSGEPFTESHVSTIGVDFKTRVHDVDDERRVKTIFWDTCGQERYRSISGSFYRGAHIIVLVYDVTNADSFINVNKWLHDINLYLGDDRFSTILLLGNKSESYRKIVDRETAQRFADERGLLFLEVSAKEGTNLEQAYLTLIKTVMEEGNMTVDVNDSVIKEGKERKKFKCCGVS